MRDAITLDIRNVPKKKGAKSVRNRVSMDQLESSTNNSL